MARDPRQGLWAPCRRRDFRYLAGALATSQIGDWLSSLALIVFVLQQTHSAGWVAAAGVARLVPFVVLGLVGGVAADRYSRRGVMVCSDLARAATMAAVAWLVADSGPTTGAIALTTLAAAFSVAYSPCVNAAVPLLVPEDELAPANAIVTAIANAAIALGPAAGGVLLVLGSPASAFAVDAGTFAGSALLVLRIRAELGPERAPTAPAAQKRAWLAHAREGFATIGSSPDVAILVFAWTATSFLYGLEAVLLALVATDRLGIGENGLALLWSAFGVGAVLATWVASRAAGRTRQGMSLAVATMLPGLALAGLALTRSPEVGFALAALDGAGALVLDVLAVTSLQRLLGNDRLGRTFGAADTLYFAGLLAGTLFAPLLLRGLSLEATLVLGGGVAVAGGIFILARVPSIDRRAEARAQGLLGRVALLAGADLFAGASRATLEALAEETRSERIPAGTVVIRQGDEPDDLFVVDEGRLAVTVEGKGVVGRLGPGEYFGEIGLLRGVPRTATVTAETECELLRTSGEIFVRLVGHGAAASPGLLQTVQARLARIGAEHEQAAR